MKPRFVDTPEQEELARGARAFVERRYPVAHLRELRARPAEERIDRARWREAAQLGWAGILVGEHDGGAGLGVVEAGLIAEQLGRALAATPFVSTAVIGATILAGRPEAGAIARGEALVALAFEERPRYAPEVCDAALRPGEGGYLLAGAKINVLDGPQADHMLVVARNGIAIVDRASPGVNVMPLARVDSRSAAQVRFADVPVPADRVIAGPDAEPLLARALARATAVLAAEMLGGADAVFATTIEYLKTRRQFGVPIGSFQALKHRAAALFCELELTRSVVRAALAALDADAPDAALLVSAAKARASDTFLAASAEAIQMHGGIGVTDELDVGFYYKRAAVAGMLLGDAAYHRDRFARLQSY
jgi:alkylation response protein AidB-like acyl-CoA dehydrogenase